MKFKNLSLFYKIYFIALAAFAVLLVIAAVSLNLWLIDYNKGIPETVSAMFFEENFMNLNAGKLVSLTGITPCEFETEDDIIKYLENEFSKNDLSYTSISTGSETDSRKYIVKSGDYKIASFVLDADENNDYYPVSVELHLPKNLNRQYKVLDSSTLYINGVRVDEKYITETTEHIGSKYLSENIDTPKWNIYTVTGFTKEPEISVIDRNQNQTTVSEADGIFCEDIVYDEPEEKVVDRLLKAAKQYAICMQNDASKASVLKYFVKGTDLYTSISSAENMFVWDHSGYSFENEKVSEFFRYDENTVSCRISFTHILHKRGTEDYKDYTDITYFAKNVNGEYQIFARYNN